MHNICLFWVESTYIYIKILETACVRSLLILSWLGNYEECRVWVRQLRKKEKNTSGNL